MAKECISRLWLMKRNKSMFVYWMRRIAHVYRIVRSNCILFLSTFQRKISVKLQFLVCLFFIRSTTKMTTANPVAPYFWYVCFKILEARIYRWREKKNHHHQHSAQAAAAGKLSIVSKIHWRAAVFANLLCWIENIFDASRKKKIFLFSKTLFYSLLIWMWVV